MPELTFIIAWPDGTEEACYSPSTIVARHFAAGDTYKLAEFVARSGRALSAASERVRARYGAPCGRALGQLARIEQRAAAFAPDAPVRVLRVGAP